MGVVILQIFTIVILIALSLTLLIPRPADGKRQGFLLFSSLLALWIGIGVVANIDSDYVLFFNRLIFVIPLWIILAAHLLIRRLVDKGSTGSLNILLAISSFLSVLIIGSGYIVADIVPRMVRGQVGGFDIIRGPLYPFYVVSLLLFISFVLWKLYKNYIQAKDDLRNQLGVVGMSVAGAAFLGVFLAVVSPIATGSSAPSEYVFLAGIVIAVGFMLAIVRHGLFDIKLAAVRSVTYLMSLLALAAMYYTVAYVISITIFQDEVTSSFSISPLNIFLALILAFIFQPVKHFFDQATDKIFYRDRYDSEAFYGRLSEILTSESTDLRKFLSRIAGEIGSTLRAETAFLHVQWGHHHATAGKKGHATFSDTEIEDIRMYVLEHQGDIIVMNTLSEKDPIYLLLAAHEIAIAVPLVQKNTVFGYLFLGNRGSGKYTARDKKVLETISNELVVAVQNALSLQEIKDFNVHLRQRIDAATSELVASNEKLKRLDAAKDEFVSMASHQLRTPLTSVKGYISMVLEGDAGKITPMQKQLLEEAFISSERMVHLIGDFLNVSRLQTGKFVLDQNLTNLADLVEEEVDGLKATAKARSLKLQYRKPANIPDLYIDAGKIHQVIMNFIDNAIYYSTEDTAITVKVGLEGGYLLFTVTDTGIGVPKDEQAQLFTKFFRATNARRQRPDGTGIGLYLAKKVIDAHDGTMIFESKEGKGSTFGFRLPIKKLSDSPQEAPSEK